MKVKKSIFNILTAFTLLLCMSFTNLAAYADDSTTLAAPSSKVAYCIERYRIFLEKTAKEYPVDTWRFGLAYIDGKLESQVQVYTCTEKGLVT